MLKQQELTDDTHPICVIINTGKHSTPTTFSYKKHERLTFLLTVSYKEKMYDHLDILPRSNSKYFYINTGKSHFLTSKILAIHQSFFF